MAPVRVVLQSTSQCHLCLVRISGTFLGRFQLLQTLNTGGEALLSILELAK